MIKIHLHVDFAMWGTSKVTIQKKYGYWLYALVELENMPIVLEYYI